MTKQEATYKYLLRLGDDALILGHRLSELCSKAPFIEEDLATTNISLDMIGRAQLLLKYAGELKGNETTEDDLAYIRAENEYYNHLLVEQPNDDFAHVIARQFFISAYEFYFYSALSHSQDTTLAAIAVKTLKEIKYHLAHSSDWTLRLGDGTEESHKRMQKAVNDLWMYTGELFEMDDVDNFLLHNNIGVDTAAIKLKWEKHIREILEEATLSVPADQYTQSGGRNGIHSEYLGHILAEMQYLQRAYPDAKW